MIQAFSAGRPSHHFLYDRDTGEYAYFAPTYLGLDENSLAPVRRFDYAARDGLAIDGFLAVPHDMEEGPQPLVVLPHGGPFFVQDSLMFDAWRQYIASRGLMVFSANFRGSSGYGTDFEAAGWGGFGTTMPRDVIDGVRELIDQGIADPDRICIAGGSYGAYMALFAAAEWPDIFQCAVGLNGVYDLVDARELFGTRDAFGMRGVALRSRFGDAANDAAALRALSPTHRASEISIPTLIIAAEEDQIVPFQQSEDLIEALRASGASPETVLFEEGDHSFGTGQSYIQALEAMGDFLDEHLN